MAKQIERHARVTLAILGADSRLVSTTPGRVPIASADRQSSQIGAGRSFNFSTVATELVASAEVYNSPQARVCESGIGGTINVVTHKPLDLMRGNDYAEATLNQGVARPERGLRSAREPTAAPHCLQNHGPAGVQGALGAFTCREAPVWQSVC